MLNQINQNLNRQSGDGALHRVRGQQGNGRIGGHGRDQMKGGRRGGRNMNGMGMQGHMSGPMMQMSPENQMQIMNMLEEQARMMSQLMPGFVPPAVNPAFQNGNQQGRSLFDRVERQGQRGGGRSNKRGQNQRPQGAADGDMDTEMGGEQNETTPTVSVVSTYDALGKTAHLPTSLLPLQRVPPSIFPMFARLEQLARTESAQDVIHHRLSSLRTNLKKCADFSPIVPTRIATLSILICRSAAMAPIARPKDASSHISKLLASSTLA